MPPFKINSMTRYRHKKYKALPIVLVVLLCLSFFVGRVFAVTGCNASCCVGDQMGRHGQSMVQVVDDVPCPCCSTSARTGDRPSRTACCSTSLACAVEKNFSPVTLAAILHDGERYSSTLFSGELAAVETHQKIENGVSLRFTEPPTKIPIYIATLALTVI